MTQDEKWLVKYREVMDFIQKEQRKPSKYYPEEKLKFHYIHHNKKLYNAGGLKAELSGNCTVELMAWFDNDDPEFSSNTGTGTCFINEHALELCSLATEGTQESHELNEQRQRADVKASAFFAYERWGNEKKFVYLQTELLITERYGKV